VYILETLSIYFRCTADIPALVLQQNPTVFPAIYGQFCGDVTKFN